METADSFKGKGNLEMENLMFEPCVKSVRVTTELATPVSMSQIALEFRIQEKSA